MLMVGALQCRNTVGPGNEAYNAFVARQRGVLDSKGYVLKGHFLRENGLASGRSAYDQYNTTMSNRHAARFDDASFCQTIAAYTRMAANATDRDFVVLAQSVIEAPDSSCTTSGFSTPASLPLPPIARRAEPLPPIAQRAEPLAPIDVVETADPYAGEPVAEPAVLAVARPPVERFAPSAAPEPVVTPAVAYAAPVRRAPAIPTVEIAAAPVVPPIEARAAPSPAAALQAAIAALQAATEALKAQGGQTN